MVEINDLPSEILEFILTYLPPYKDLEECKLVNKRWNDIVKDVIRSSRRNFIKGITDYQLCWQDQPLVCTTPTIAGRFSHSAVIHQNSMYVFGGGSSSDTTFNDLWRYDLSEMKWIRPWSIGNYPSPKCSATMVSYKEQLILFGGWRYPSLHPPHQPWCLFDELHLYDLKTNRWILKTSNSFAPPTAGHSATVHGDKMVVFGGYQKHGDANIISNDTWRLDLETFTWSTPIIIGNNKPPPRYGQFQIKLDDYHLLVVGGCGGPNNMYSDAWILDMTNNTRWQWKSVLIKNKKWTATHMWCNPSCKVGSKLIVLGPTPNLPTDFQIMKQLQPNGISNRNQHNRLENLRRDEFGNQPDPYLRNEPDHRQAQIVNNINFNNNNNNPRFGALNRINRIEEQNQNNRQMNIQNDNQVNLLDANNMNNLNNGNEDEAANRLQRNLALRCRDHDPRLPKRFDEPYEDRFKMAAFNIQNRQRSLSQDHQERIRRMEEKMNVLRNARRAVAEQRFKEPSPKRAKRNVLSMFVCDLANALSVDDPHLKWMEYKNYGILPGAPERLIFSSIVAGNNELILFGGVQKETLSEFTHQVSNSVHFITCPKEII